MRNLPPPPTYVTDVSDPMWKQWFSSLYNAYSELSGGGGGGGGATGGIPPGGLPGQILVKSAISDFAVRWEDQQELPIGIPAGGTKDHVLTKLSDLDYHVAWEPIEDLVVLDKIDGGNAPLSIPQTERLDGGNADFDINFLSYVDGGTA